MYLTACYFDIGCLAKFNTVTCLVLIPALSRNSKGWRTAHFWTPLQKRCFCQKLSHLTLTCPTFYLSDGHLSTVQILNQEFSTVNVSGKTLQNVRRKTEERESPVDFSLKNISGPEVLLSKRALTMLTRCRCCPDLYLYSIHWEKLHGEIQFNMIDIHSNPTNTTFLLTC